MKSVEQTTILVVDDTEQARYATARVLRQAGYHVLEAANGTDGMRLAGQHPDLIIMDVKLPDANGIDLSRQLKESAETRLIPVLQLSATYITTSDKARGLEAGADAYLTGPVASDELLATIRMLLRLKTTQETLAQAEHRQRMALQLGHAFSFEWNPATDEVLRSEEAGQILGLSGHEITHDTGQQYFSRIHPDDRKSFITLVRGLTPSADTYKTGYRLFRGDGTIIMIEEAGRAYFDAQGTITSLIGISQDVTERKQMEQAVLRSEATLRSFFESAPMMCGIVSIPPDGDLLHIFENPATLAYLKSQAKTVAGKRLSELGVPPHLIHLWRAKHLEGIRERRPVYFEYQHDDRWIGCTVNPVASPGSGDPQSCYIAEDITERKNFQAELERKVAERTRSLQETTEQLNDFCYSVAHDLKAPIRGQTAIADMLLSDYGETLDETGKQYVRRIHDSANRQALLVQDLLAHMSLGRTDLPLEPVDTAAAVAAVLKEFRTEIEASKAVVQTRLGGCVIVANPSSLHLVLSNLISNALKFTHPNTPPDILISCAEQGGDIILSVTDKGIGVDPQHAQKIWGVFQRLHTRDRYPGTGIGLAIVKKAVERMSGSVGIESTPGIGSRFWVRLPRAPQLLAAR